MVGQRSETHASAPQQDAPEHRLVHAAEQVDGVGHARVGDEPLDVDTGDGARDDQPRVRLGRAQPRKRVDDDGHPLLGVDVADARAITRPAPSGRYGSTAGGGHAGCGIRKTGPL